ncbi:uncharacterized protein B0H18DRAFT_1119802 [Fomitopsis serialis]|uniref:uncharacterized protein n=1 Tax=Fomitopsis serialis TaxID=139415 RepID=UPI0020087B15|nr:uncharacterized protein B0H18DRAFT_1119802 [Neoantrodia serialis]KAH9924786.1 hypothetical protein B0H18DRAFT_1119802 [Neoantrodia serialis]
MALGHYPLRLPSYRSAHARRYHPYPAARRHTNNDEFYMDPVPDFDFEAAEHMLEVPPTLQLQPVRRDDDDGDVTAFELDGSAKKDAQEENKPEDHGKVVVARARGDGVEVKSAMAQPSTRLKALYTLFLFLHYVRDSLTKSRAKSSTKTLRK